MNLLTLMRPDCSRTPRRTSAFSTPGLIRSRTRCAIGLHRRSDRRRARSSSGGPRYGRRGAGRRACRGFRGRRRSSAWPSDAHVDADVRANRDRRVARAAAADPAALSLSAQRLRLFHSSQSEKPRGLSAFATAQSWVRWARSNLDRDSAAERAQARSFFGEFLVSLVVAKLGTHSLSL
jgi:hypothetical protein